MMFRKALCIVVTMVMLLASLSACATSSNNGSAATSGVTQAASSGSTVADVKATTPKPVTLKFMKMYDWASNPAGWKWGDDPVTKKLTEVTGVTLEIMSPAGKGDEKASIMLMSGDYPDIMWMDRNSVLQKYIDAGALYSIDELAGKYGCPNIMGNYISQKTVDYLKNEDGKLYLIPNWYSEHGELSVGSSIMYREDIYKQLGSPKLETLDDYTNYLRKIKESNISFAGQKVYPIALEDNFARIMSLGNFWGESNANNMYFDQTDNTVKFAMRSKGAYEAAKWWNMLFREGLTDPEFITLKTEQRKEAYIKGKYGAMIGAFWDNEVYQDSLQKINPDAHYVSVNPLPAVSGVQAKFDGYSLVGWNANVITKNCKDPEAAIKFYDYYISPEGQRLTFSGVEGISMEKVLDNGIGLLKQDVFDSMQKDWSGTSVKYGVRLVDIAQNQKYNWEYAMEVGLRKSNRATVESTNWDATPMQIMQFDASSDEGKKWANIQGVINTTGLIKALTAKTEADFTKEYNNLLSDFENMGLKDVEKKWTEKYLAITNKK